MRLGLGRVVTVCMCVYVLVGIAVPGSAYSSADVKRGEKLIANRDYTAAIGLLSDITKDLEFCSADPADAARAGMLLCDAYEATGNGKSDACKAASEASQIALVQLWAVVKKQEAAAKRRFEMIAPVCEGHPEEFAWFIKKTLDGVIDATAEVDRSAVVDVALGLYRGIVQSGDNVPDMDLLYFIAEHFNRLTDSKKVIEVLNVAVDTTAEKRKELNAKPLYLLTQSHYLVGNYEQAIARGRQLLQMSLSAEIRCNTEFYIARSLEEAGRLDEAAEFLRSMAADVDKPEERANRLADIGDLYYRAKKYASAIEAYRTAQSGPAAAKALKIRVRYGIGLCHRGMGLTDTAIEDMKAVVALDSQSKWAGLARGQLLELLRDESAL